jgi:hypothetical protein
MRRFRELVELAQQLVRRFGTQDIGRAQAERVRRLTREPRMVDSLLTASAPLLPAATVVGAFADGVPDVNEAGVVVGLFEQRQRSAGERVDLVHPRVGSELHAVAGGDDAGERFACKVVRNRRSLGGALGDRHRLPVVGSHGFGELELEVDVEPERTCERERALEQGRCSTFVAARKRAPASGGEPLSRTLAEARVWLLELGPVARGLFEVMAEDLVQLDEVRRPFFEPRGKAFVQVGPGRFGESVVGGVADQEMVEAVGLLPGELRSIGPDELLADERVQHWRQRVAVYESLDGALVEDIALDRAALEHRPLGRVELVETCREECLDRRGHADLGVARIAHEREHLLQEERVSLGGGRDPPTQAGLDTAEFVQQPLGLGGVERLEQHGR